jgi:aspartate kinase
MLRIQKYGGTSVGSPERIRAVARRVANARRRGDRVVVVVSAMGHTTDEYEALAQEVTGGRQPAFDHPREMDMLLSAGERISMALLAMAIRTEGVEARSLTGSQAAIITDGSHTAARIREVRADRVNAALDEGCVPIVAGFQGVSTEREITTLGRGGSDTTAVALAAVLHADVCEVYTDVDGIFTADPRRVPDARIIPRISHDEVLEMAVGGSQVMAARAVDMAARFGLDVRVLSSFSPDDAAPTDETGTLITRDPGDMEALALTSIASSRGQAKLIVRGLPPGMRTSTEILTTLADAGVSVDMITSAEERDGTMVLQLTVSEERLDRARTLVKEAAARLGGGGEVTVHPSLARLALVGSGMHGRPGVYARAYEVLAAAGVEVEAVSTSAISITLLVAEAREDDALRALHQAFELDMAAAVPASGGG